MKRIAQCYALGGVGDNEDMCDMILEEDLSNSDISELLETGSVQVVLRGRKLTLVLCVERFV